MVLFPKDHLHRQGECSLVFGYSVYMEWNESENVVCKNRIARVLDSAIENRTETNYSQCGIA